MILVSGPYGKPATLTKDDGDLILQALQDSFNHADLNLPYMARDNPEGTLPTRMKMVKLASLKSRLSEVIKQGTD